MNQLEWVKDGAGANRITQGLHNLLDKVLNDLQKSAL